MVEAVNKAIGGGSGGVVAARRMPSRDIVLTFRSSVDTVTKDIT